MRSTVRLRMILHLIFLIPYSFRKGIRIFHSPIAFGVGFRKKRTGWFRTGRKAFPIIRRRKCHAPEYLGVFKVKRSIGVIIFPSTERGRNLSSGSELRTLAICSFRICTAPSLTLQYYSFFQIIRIKLCFVRFFRRFRFRSRSRFRNSLRKCSRWLLLF